MTASPLLSLFIGARNDAYMGDSLWRCQTMINYLGQGLEGLGRQDDVELVVCDWGSERPLHTVLDLTPAGRRIVRFILVPPDVARSHRHEGNDYPMAVIQNTAVRRCRGKFIAQTDGDLLFPPATLSRLLRLLEDGQWHGIPANLAYFFATRRYILLRYAASTPPLEELSRVIRNFGPLFPENPWFQIGGKAYTGTGFVLMHRDLWHESTGYDERFTGWGWLDIYLAFRILQRYPWADLSGHGFDLFHLNHHAVGGRNAPSRTLNPHIWKGLEFRGNGPGWGMADHEFPEFTFPRGGDAPPAKTPLRGNALRTLHLWPLLIYAPIQMFLPREIRSRLWRIPQRLAIALENFRSRRSRG